jgi:hypothetical protein
LVEGAEDVLAAIAQAPADAQPQLHRLTEWALA